MYDFAILGGAFNPIHNGHIYIAEQIIQHKLAKEVIFIPNGNHPLKSTSLLLPYSERLALIDKAIEDYSNFSVSELDSPTYGINYTFHLIKRIKEEYADKKFTFIIGYDNAVNFSKWYQYEWLLNNVSFTVVTRNDSQRDKEDIDQRFNMLEIIPYDISSTEVRQKLQTGQDVSTLVPKNILNQLLDYWKKLRLLSHQ